MGTGYYVLVWDDWGVGLNMINPLGVQYVL